MSSTKVGTRTFNTPFIEGERREVMLDLETLDVIPTARIIEIGICEVPKSPERWTKQAMTDLVKTRIHVSPVKLPSQSLLDMTTSQSTIDWYKLEEARWKLLTYCHEYGLDIKTSLQALTDFLLAFKPTHIWCKGGSFDFAILRHAYAKCGLELPWEFRSERDLRTWQDVLTVKQLEAVRTRAVNTFKLNLHDALDDAILQAYVLADCNEEMEFLTGAAVGRGTYCE